MEEVLRKVLRCKECKLVQYKTVSNLCRKCNHPLSQPSDFDLPLDNGCGDRLPPHSLHTRIRHKLIIGKTLCEYRQQANLSQKKLAEKAGMYHSYISRIENNNLLPGLVILQRIAEALGVNIVNLLPPKTENALEAWWRSFIPLFIELQLEKMDEVINRLREMVTLNNRRKRPGRPSSLQKVR